MIVQCSTQESMQMSIVSSDRPDFSDPDSRIRNGYPEITCRDIIPQLRTVIIRLSLIKYLMYIYVVLPRFLHSSDIRIA